MKKLISLSLLLLFFATMRAQSLFQYTDSLKMESHTAQYKISFPILSGSPQFMNIYNKWLIGDFQNNDKKYIYKSGTLDYKKMAKFYRDAFFSEDEGVGFGFSWESKIKLIEDNSVFVTLEEVGYDYRGGAHGLSTDCGVTISREGKIMAWDDWFVQKAPLSRLVAEEITKQYFQGNREHVMSFVGGEGKTFNTMPLPNMSPWLKGNNMVFLYVSYEMGSYSIGMPKCEIPISKLMPYMTAKAKKMIKDSEGKRNVSKKLRVIKVYSLADNLPATQNNTYGLTNMFDGNDATCWAHRIKNDAEYNSAIPFGVSISLKYKRIDKIVIHNGYAKNKTTYLNNSRPKTIFLANKKPASASDYSCRFLTTDLNDTMAPQTIVVMNGTIDSTSMLFLGVEDIYKGDKWNDLCISEIEIWGAE